MKPLLKLIPWLFVALFGSEIVAVLATMVPLLALVVDGLLAEIARRTGRTVKVLKATLDAPPGCGRVARSSSWP